MHSDPETKLQAQDVVEDDILENRELTMDELVALSGGGDGVVFSGTSQGPDWGN